MNSIQIISNLQAKGYTPTQVVNSLQRSVAHQNKVGSAITKAAYKKALRTAEDAATKAFVEAAKEGKHIPCNEECMMAAHEVCVCPCGGVNHGLHLVQLISA